MCNLQSTGVGEHVRPSLPHAHRSPDTHTPAQALAPRTTAAPRPGPCALGCCRGWPKPSDSYMMEGKSLPWSSDAPWRRPCQAVLICSRCMAELVHLMRPPAALCHRLWPTLGGVCLQRPGSKPPPGGPGAQAALEEQTRLALPLCCLPQRGQPHCRQLRGRTDHRKDVLIPCCLWLGEAARGPHPSWGRPGLSIVSRVVFRH